MVHLPKSSHRGHPQKTADRTILPTAERLTKGDYEIHGVGKHKRTYRANTLLSLRKAGRIDSAAESAALTWLREYLYAFAGYRDDVPNRTATADTLSNDAITAHLNRAKAAERLHYVRDILGNAQEETLTMMMVEGLSFRRMAEKIMPHKSPTRGAEEIAVLCATILNTLHGAYTVARQLQKERSKKARPHQTLNPKSRIRANEFTGPS